MVTMFERFLQLEYSESYTCNMHDDARIEGYHYCICHWVSIWNTLGSELPLIHFNGGNSWCRYLQHWWWGYKVFDSHARDMYGNSHSEGTCVLLKIKSMHKLIQYFQSLYGNEHKGVHIAHFEVDIFSSSVKYWSISNVNSYQCSCKQCCAVAVYAMCYSVINPCGYWTLRTLSAHVGNRNTLYNVMAVKRHFMPVDLPQSVSISGAEINLTFRTVSTCVLCCNLAESKSVLKMCFSKHCHDVTGFLLWIGTYCISCVV